MGSRKKTYSSLSVNRMFEQKDNLFAKEMVRIYAQTKSIDPAVIFPIMLTDTFTFFNEKVFEKMGATAEVEFTNEIVDTKQLLQFIQDNIDSDAKEITGFGVTDNEGTAVNSSIYKLRELMSGNEEDNSHSVYLYQELDFTFALDYTEKYPAYVINDKSYVFSTKLGEPIITSGIYLNKRVEMHSVDDPMDVIQVDIADDQREVYAVEYTTDTQTKGTYLYSEKLIRTAESYKAFILLMRRNFENIGDDERERKFLYARFGLNAEDKDGNTLEDSLDQEDLKDAWLSYSTSRDDPKFSYLVDQFYSTSVVKENEDTKIYAATGETKQVIVSGDIYLDYTVSSNMGSFEGKSYAVYMINYEKKEIFADSKGEDGALPLYIIPIGPLLHLPFKDKYEAYNSMFCMWVYSEKTVKLKWYQTTIFRIIMFIVSIFVPVLLGWVSAATAVLNAVVGMVASFALSSLDPRLAAVLSVIIGVMTGYIDVTSFSLNLLNNVLNIVMAFNTAAFQSDIASMKNQISYMQDETKKNIEEIQETLHDTIFIPFDDRVDILYNGMYDFAYNGLDIIDTVFDSGPKKLEVYYK